MALQLLFGFAFLVCIGCNGIFGKECTNTPTELSSHTIREKLLTTKNSTWKAEILSDYHLTPTDESAWMDLRPRKLLHESAPQEEFDWRMFYRSMNGHSKIMQLPGINSLREVSLHDVRLDPDSIYGRAQQTNLEYLLLLEVDRLVWSFRNQAGLSAPGNPYGGWEAPDMEIRGHFVGHYMSATAHIWASTHNDTIYKKMSSVVDALYDCQKKIGTGYLSAFPSEFFDRFEAIKYVWAPYYTIHKIMAGLLDQYSLAGNSKALQMVVWMAEYFGNRVKNVIQKYTIERHWTSLNEETGGMNDVLYRLYSITNDPKHMILAHLFDKPCFLGLLAVQADSISGFHSNTHIPVVVGAQMRYETTGDPLYKEISTFFMDIVNSSHSYATGGTSVSEFWYNPKRMADTLNTESQESCTTYNMLKVSRNLFRWTKEISYADYYERALTNGVLSIQRGREPGIMIYMLPQGPGQSKAQSYHGWGTKFDSFWCCYGTGIESFSKLGDSIYFEEKGTTPVLYIIQYIPSTFSWNSAEIMLNQRMEPVKSWDPFLKVSIAILVNENRSQSSTMNLRIPFWSSLAGAEAILNGQALQLPYPGNFLSVTRSWTLDDNLVLKLPLLLRTEGIKDERPEYASVHAILFGPYLLAGLTSGDWEVNRGNSSSVSDWVTSVPSSYGSQLISLSQESNNKTFVFSNTNGSITMEEWPKAGTDSAVYGTFRLYSQDSKGPRIIRRNVTAIQSPMILEPFVLPGMVVVQQGPSNNLVVSSNCKSDCTFYVVQGLDGKPSTVSLESGNNPGCYLATGTGYSAGVKVQLQCRLSASDSSSRESFNQAASFNLLPGMRRYNPVSFFVRGVRQNFLLEPLLSLRDETYTVYFSLNS